MLCVASVRPGLPDLTVICFCIHIGPIRTWSKPNDTVSPCGNNTITGWARQESAGPQSSRLNITQKSWYSARWIIDHFCARHEGVVDATCGTGTSGDAALRTGRNFLGFDRCPDAVEACQQRFQAVQEQELACLGWAGLVQPSTEQEAEELRQAQESTKEASLRQSDKVMTEEDVKKCMDVVTRGVKLAKDVGMLKDLPDEDVSRWEQATAVFLAHCPPKWAADFLKKDPLKVAGWVTERGTLFRMVNEARLVQKFPMLVAGHVMSADLWEVSRKDE